MHNDIEITEKALTIAKAFVQKYETKLTSDESTSYISLTTTSLELYMSQADCILAGAVFGKTGWIRRYGYSGKFNWEKEVDGVKVTIRDAEDMDLDKTPVAPSAFPIQLENSSSSCP